MSSPVPEPKAIEIAALLGDSIVDVKHCVDPRGGTVRRTTLVYVGAAVLLLALAALAFAVSVHIASENQLAFARWTHVLHRPAYAFRPHLLAAGYDGVVLGGLGLGLAFAAIGLARWRAERRSPAYRIGTAPGVDLALADAPAPAFPLVAPTRDRDDFVFTYAPGIEGELSIDGTTTPLAVLAARGRPSAHVAGAVELPIPARATIRARAGKATFAIAAVAPPRRQAVPGFAPLEGRMARYLAGSLVVHVALLVLLAQIPEGDGTAIIDLNELDSLAINASLVDHETRPPDAQPDTDGGGASATSPASAAMALDSGRAGTPREAARARLAVPDNHVDPQLARRRAIDAARDTGILGETSALQAGAFTDLVAVADLESGFAERSIYGADDEVGDASQGTFGLSRSGFGPGGCVGRGPCDGIIGTGAHYATIGTGVHAGSTWGTGPGDGPGGHRHVAAVPRVFIGQSDTVGDYDRSIIRRYIRRNASKISYCYERALLSHPQLAGQIAVQFFISPAGTVSGARASGFDPDVATCVAGVVSRIEFPRAATGGVSVRYPFEFRSTGG